MNATILIIEDEASIRTVVRAYLEQAGFRVLPADSRPEGVELARVLAPGGRLVIEEPDIHRPAVKLVALAERMALMGSTFLAPEIVRDLLAAQELHAQVAERDRFSAWIVADKPSGETP